MHLIKTQIGQQVFKDRSIKLSPHQRSAFIIFDGKKSIEDVLLATSGLGVTQEDIGHMVALGLLAESSQESIASVSASPIEAQFETQEDQPIDLAQAQMRYARAYPIATQITASLGLRGFRLNLAVEAVGSYSQLLALFPKIKDAVGAAKCAELENALTGKL